jgi:two-component system alkaline phosphatase synthesis response regulator PhoP
MSRYNILVVDDEKDIRDLLDFNLAKNNYGVRSVGTGEDALAAIKNEIPDVVLLDLMLPGMDGLEVCKQLRGEAATKELPIIMISAKGEEADVVVGLELGADDYVTKPFSPRVLLARIRAVLRRREEKKQGKPGFIANERLVIDLDRHEARFDGQLLSLTALEMRILSTLAGAPGKVFTRYQIVEATQGVGVGVTDRSVDVHIVSLRRKLGQAAHLIETVRGVGYRFSESDT